MHTDYNVRLFGQDQSVNSYHSIKLKRTNAILYPIIYIHNGRCMCARYVKTPPELSHFECHLERDKLNRTFHIRCSDVNRCDDRQQDDSQLTHIQLKVRSSFPVEPRTQQLNENPDTVNVRNLREQQPTLFTAKTVEDYRSPEALSRRTCLPTCGPNARRRIRWRKW